MPQVYTLCAELRNSYLYQKLGVINRAEAVMVAMRRNLIPTQS